MLFLAIIVTGGMSYTSRKSVDILKEDGTHFCSLPDLPESRYSHTQSGLVTCGGFESMQLKSCLTFSNGVWEETHSNSLIQGRYDHSAWTNRQCDRTHPYDGNGHYLEGNTASMGQSIRSFFALCVSDIRCHRWKTSEADRNFWAIRLAL